MAPRRFGLNVALGLLLPILASAVFVGVAAQGRDAIAQAAKSASPAKQFTNWGWPLPYEQISQKSIDGLKAKGWWPLQVAWQPPASDSNTRFAVMEALNLLGKRGLQAKFTQFLSGPEEIEAFSAGRMQVGVFGTLPEISLLVSGVPVKSFTAMNVSGRHALVVPAGSPIHKIDDLRANGGKPHVVGLALGSSAQFLMGKLAELNHLEIGKDVTLINLPIPEQATLPGGVDAIVPWDPLAAQLIASGKVRQLATIIDYQLFHGEVAMRGELIAAFPDVAQAISDAYVEAVLWTRLHPEKTADIMQKVPSLSGYSKDLLIKQINLYSNFYKPTYGYLFPEFWSVENDLVGQWALKQGLIKQAPSRDAIKASFATELLANTYKKLGWAVPKRPVLLPSGWTGKVGNPPYPPYINPIQGDWAPQKWPEAGDLTASWTFNGTTYKP